MSSSGTAVYAPSQSIHGPQIPRFARDDTSSRGLGISAVQALRIRPATFLVFLAASARARIVASNFCPRAHHLLNLHVASTSHARLFQLLLFLALECLFDIVHGCGNLTRRASIATTTAGDDCRYAGLGSLARRPLGSATRPRSLVRWPLHDLHQVQVADRFFLKALHHLFEHVVGLALVLDQRIMLSVAAQVDALLQVVHREQVIFPLP